MVAIHISNKLVSSVLLFMKKASWGYCLLVFYSTCEPAGLLRVGVYCNPRGSGTEFEVRRTTSREEGDDATMNAPMGLFCLRVKRDLI